MALNDGSGLSEELQSKLMKLGLVSDALTAQWTKGSKVDKLRQLAEQNLAEQLKSRLNLGEKEAAQAAKQFIEAEKRANYEQQRAQAMAEAAKKTVSGFTNLASGAMSAAQAAVNSADVYAGASSTLQLMGNAIKTVSDIISTAVSGIPIIGGFLAAADKAAAAVTDLSIQVLQMELEFAQQYFNSYQAISKAGASFGGSLGAAQKAAESMGLSLQRYQKFITENVEALTSFGGGIGKASQVVGQLGLNARKMDQSLLVAYGTQEDINGALSGYAQMMAGVGVDIGKSQKALAAGSKDYLWQLKELTELTGISADRYRKEAAERQSNIIFQRKMQEAEAKLGKDQFAKFLPQFNKQLSMIGADFGPDAMKAVQDAIGRGGVGNVIDPDSIAMFASSPALRELADTMSQRFATKTGKESDIEFANLIAKTGKELAETRGPTEMFPGAAKYLDNINTATAMAIANQARITNLPADMEEMYKRRAERKDLKGYPGAYDEKVAVEIKQNQITSENLAKMGKLAEAMYQIQQKLIDNFGDFSGAVVSFGEWVQKLLDAKDPDAADARKRRKEELEYHKQQVEKNIKSQYLLGSSDPKAAASAILKNMSGGAKGHRTISEYGGKAYLEALAKEGPDTKVQPNYSGEMSDLGDEKLNKLMKSGAMRKGGTIDDKLSMALQSFMTSDANSKFPIGQITALNDAYHKDMGGKHALGQAVDFTLAGVSGFNPENFTSAQGEALAKALRESGFTSVLDEYHTKSAGWTGGHIHAQLKDGAIVDAVSGGRTVNVGEGGRPEGVFPIDENRPVPMKLDRDQFAELVRVLVEHKEVSENLLANS